MNKDHTKWPLVVALAKAQGAKDLTVDKWKQRGVPSNWHVRLIIASKGALKPEDFQEVKEGAA